MAGFFRYRPTGFPGVGNQVSYPFRQYLAFLKGCQVAAISEVIPASTSGSYSVTGVGFQPQALLLFTDAANQDVLNVDGQIAAIGCATSASDRWTVSLSSDFGDISTRRSSAATDKLLEALTNKTSSSPYYYDFSCDIDSLDADGFTIDVTTCTIDTRIYGLAVAHPTGNFACGTEQCPTTNGTQSISGLGFQPTSIFFASSQQDTLGLGALGSYMACGVADDPNGSFGIWTGASSSGDPYIDMTAYEKPISMWIDADAAGPFDPTVIAEADLDSYDGDGFTLDWTTTDGTQRYYHWFAIEEAVEANRFTFFAFSGDVDIATRDDPLGLWFFQNDMTLNATGGSPGQGGDHNTETYGQSWGFGMCGPMPSLEQGSISGGATAEHTFPFVELSSRYGSVDLAFGAGGRGNQGILGESPEPKSYGEIIRMSGLSFRPQIYRRVLN